MGTRNLTKVIIDGVTKVAQYGQWDGYPEGQGATILNFFEKANLHEFKQKVRDLPEWITQERIDQLYKDAGHDGGRWVKMSVSNKFKAANPQLDRDMGAGVLDYIYNSTDKVLLNDYSEFINDSLSCEWAYIIDLDNETLSIKNGADKTYSLHNLPALEQLVKDCSE